MTDSEINVAIAEALGWTDIMVGRHPYTKDDVTIVVGVSPDGTHSIISFATDLNAMHEAIIAQNWAPAQQMAFMAYLAHKRGDFALVNATARQRAEAFCRVKGIWKDDV